MQVLGHSQAEGADSARTLPALGRLVAGPGLLPEPGGVQQEARHPEQSTEQARQGSLFIEA